MKSRGEALRDYVVRRLLLMIPTFIGITFVTFLLTAIRARRARSINCGCNWPVAEATGEAAARGRFQLEIPENQLQQLQAFYGFDKPFPVAYVAVAW